MGNPLSATNYRQGFPTKRQLCTGMAHLIAGLDTRKETIYSPTGILLHLSRCYHPDVLWATILSLSFQVHPDGEVVLSAHDEIQQDAVWMSILRPRHQSEIRVIWPTRTQIMATQQQTAGTGTSNK